MATLHASAQRAMEKGKGKRKAEQMDIGEPAGGSASEPRKKRNKQRVLLLSSRGVTHRMRHLMNDLEALLPHVKKGTHCSRGLPSALAELGLPCRFEA
jgi:ribosome biogenesis protein BRX1